MNGLYHIISLIMYGLGPGIIFVIFLSFISKQNCGRCVCVSFQSIIVRPVMDSNHHAKFHPCILFFFLDVLV